MHWTGVPMQSARAVRQFFEDRKEGRFGYGSAHYIVDLDGTILRCIPETEVAYHVGSDKPDPVSGRIYTDLARAEFGPTIDDPAKTIAPNLVTLGIEMCATDAEGHFRDATLSAAIDLAADICIRRDLNPFQHLWTHHGVVGWKDCPRLWTNQPKLFGEFQSQVASAIAKGVAL